MFFPYIFFKRYVITGKSRYAINEKSRASTIYSVLVVSDRHGTSNIS